MNVIEPFPKQQILTDILKMRMSEEQLNFMNGVIETKLAEGAVQAREVHMQPELDRISDLYKTAMNEVKDNLKSDYDFINKTIQQIETTDNLSEVTLISLSFHISMNVTLKIRVKHALEIKNLENRIVSLLPPDTPFFKF